jgi:hypothetical protein
VPAVADLPRLAPEVGRQLRRPHQAATASTRMGRGRPGHQAKVVLLQLLLAGLGRAAWFSWQAAALTGRTRSRQLCCTGWPCSTLRGGSCCPVRTAHVLLSRDHNVYHAMARPMARCSTTRCSPWPALPHCTHHSSLCTVSHPPAVWTPNLHQVLVPGFPVFWPPPQTGAALPRLHPVAGNLVPLPVLGCSVLFLAALADKGLAESSAGGSGGSTAPSVSPWALPVPLQQLEVQARGGAQLAVLGPGQQLPVGQHHAQRSTGGLATGHTSPGGGIAAAQLAAALDAAKAAVGGSGQEAAVEAAQRAVHAGGSVAGVLTAKGKHADDKGAGVQSPTTCCIAKGKQARGSCQHVHGPAGPMGGLSHATMTHIYRHCRPGRQHVGAATGRRGRHSGVAARAGNLATAGGLATQDVARCPVSQRRFCHMPRNGFR